MMETFSLIDDKKQSSLRDDLSLYEIYNTRLLRLDVEPRSRTDPFQSWLHGRLRAFWYRRLSVARPQATEEGPGPSFAGRHRSEWSYRNTILIAEIAGRLAAAALIVLFLVVPLVILSEGSSSVQLVVVSMCILILSFLVSLFLKVSTFETIAVSAAYAAVLSVFVSNVSGSG